MTAHTEGPDGRLACSALPRLESAYLAGTLPPAEAMALEHHAAECASCGERLELLTRRETSTFAPALPAAARGATLARVAAVRRGRARRAPWAWTLALSAAAALGFAVLGPWRDALPRSSGRQVTVTPSTGTAPGGGTSGVAAEPVAIATARSASEFAALDAAARELEQALAAAPDDDELRDFLAAVTARRAELQRRVQDAAS